MSAPLVTFEVAKRFAYLRRRLLATCLGVLLASTVTALVISWVVLAAGDYTWEWSSTGRHTGLVVTAIFVLSTAAWRLSATLRSCRRRPLVGRLESSYEDFGQRVRTVLDAVDGRLTAPDEMLGALGHQTLGRWETLGPLRLVPLRALGIASGACLVALVTAASLFALGHDWRTAMLRAVGAQIPYTRMTVAPGNVRLLEGSPVEVSLELSGRTRRDVTLRYRAVAASAGTPEELADAPSPWIESELLPAAAGDADPPPRQAAFTASLGTASEPLEYQFVTSAGTTPVYRIDVQPLIQSQRIEALVKSPAYTGLQPRTFASPDVTVLEQSEVTVTVQTNHPLAHATLQVGENRAALQPASATASQDGTRWSFQLPTRSAVEWRFSGAGHDGTPMTPVKGRVRVLRDRAPTLSWRDPPDEIRVHTLAELPMQIQVSDDYGITESGIAFQLGSEEFVLTQWSGDDTADPAASTTRMRLKETLPLESFGLSERDYIAYYAYAVDNRGSGSQRIESDIRYVDIRPLRQFYSEIEDEPNAGDGGGVLTELSEIIRRERFLINQTRKLVRSASTELSAQLGRIDRMVENQSELASLTRLLAEFMASRGNDDIEALSQAEAAMLQAADSLAAGNFELAMAQEEDALRALAEARRTLEVTLRKNMTAAQQRALQRLAAQLRQKLRRERPETERELVDTLQQLAADQMRLGQAAARLQQQTSAPAAAAGGSGGSTPAAEPAAKSPAEDPASGARQEPASGEPPGGARGENEAASGPSGEAREGQPDAASNAPSSTEPMTDRSGDPAGAAGENPAEDSIGEPSGDAPAPDAADPQPSPEEPLETLFATQLDLLDRLQEIEDGLAEQLDRSALMTQRIAETKAGMDQLAKQARDGALAGFPGASRGAAAQLRELSLQLDALTAPEAVSRISSLRDLTASLVDMESSVAEQMERSPGPAGAPREEEKGNRPADADTLDQVANRLRSRAETIEDVLHTPAEVGDLEGSEVNANLEQLVEETEFLAQLAATKQAATVLEEPPADPLPAAEQARSRATEFAEAAYRLDSLYRQLVEPRVDRLRQLEQQAGTLAQQMREGTVPEESPQAKAGLGKLQKDLQQAGLEELAARLNGRPAPETLPGSSITGGPGGTAGWSPLDGHTHRERVIAVSKELQARIQEMILLEISADRDSPVPEEYRTAVDRYFGVIAGGAESTEDRGQ